MLFFPQGGTCVPCPPLCALVAPSFDISGRDLILDGALFWIHVPDSAICAGVVEELGWCGEFYWSWRPLARLPE